LRSLDRLAILLNIKFVLYNNKMEKPKTKNSKYAPMKAWKKWKNDPKNAKALEKLRSRNRNIDDEDELYDIFEGLLRHMLKSGVSKNDLWNDYKSHIINDHHLRRFIRTTMDPTTIKHEKKLQNHLKFIDLLKEEVIVLRKDINDLRKGGELLGLGKNNSYV